MINKTTIEGDYTFYQKPNDKKVYCEYGNSMRMSFRTFDEGAEPLIALLKAFGNLFIKQKDLRIENEEAKLYKSTDQAQVKTILSLEKENKELKNNDYIKHIEENNQSHHVERGKQKLYIESLLNRITFMEGSQDKNKYIKHLEKTIEEQNNDIKEEKERDNSILQLERENNDLKERLRKGKEIHETVFRIFLEIYSKLYNMKDIF